MVRQRVVPASPPTIPPDKSIPILESHIAEADKLRSEVPHSPARQEWIQTGECALIAALGEDNSTVHSFGLAQCGATSRNDTPQYRMRQANEQLDGMIAALRSAVQQLRWNLPDPKQVFLPAGSPHDAYIEIRKVIAQVTTEVLIVDAWVNETLWPLLRNLPATAKIRILTANMRGDFALEGRKFAAQHGNTIGVRTTPSFHDRFIFVDGGKCWHLGASIKDAGNKAFVMSEMADPAIAAFIKQTAETSWCNSPVVPL